ncbi:MAG TPA: hypothetical protein GX747_00455 [Tenericutes bacterium]|nr:hypothetical protein [Mycoplasmatota bacterium]
MKLLGKQNWWFWLILNFLLQGSGTIALAILTDCFDENAWYANWRNWLIGTVCFIFPVFIMASIFILQMTAQVAAKLNVKGHEIYLSPYVWLILLIIPIFGWALFFVLILYLQIWTLVMLYKGEGEKYIK